MISFVFASGNSSDAFLILRAQGLGLSVTSVVLVYVFFNFTYAIFSMPAGIISDKIGPKKVLLTGFFLFSVVYLFFWLGTFQYFYLDTFPGLWNVYGFHRGGGQGIHF